MYLCMYYVHTYVILRVYNGEKSIELPYMYTIKNDSVSSISGYYSKLTFMIEVMIKCF